MRYVVIFLTSFLRIVSGFVEPKMLPLWYPLMPIKNAENKQIQKIFIHDRPYVFYKSSDNNYIIHTDICPHQGASLSKGWINKNGNLQCPYHGFEFCSGMFCKIPNPSKNIPYFNSKTILPTFPIKIDSDIVFMFPNSSGTSEDIVPFFPPEEYSESFRGVSGVRIIQQNYKMVVENLLDMLHISYVHSFGSQNTPLPTDIRYSDISKIGGRTTFEYSPNRDTISNRVGNTNKVIVENEFYLPTNTITRVYAGKIVKTVFTRCLPIRENETLLFWKIYRNFWIDPYSDTFSSIGDFLIRFLMDKTINEDADILKHVYNNQTSTLSTKYDITIQKYRKKYNDFRIQSDLLPSRLTGLPIFHPLSVEE